MNIWGTARLLNHFYRHFRQIVDGSEDHISHESEQRESDCYHRPGVWWCRQEIIGGPNQISKVRECVPYNDTEEGGSDDVVDRIVHRLTSFRGDWRGELCITHYILPSLFYIGHF